MTTSEFTFTPQLLHHLLPPSLTFTSPSLPPSLTSLPPSPPPLSLSLTSFPHLSSYLLPPSLSPPPPSPPSPSLPHLPLSLTSPLPLSLTSPLPLSLTSFPHLSSYLLPPSLSPLPPPSLPHLLPSDQHGGHGRCQAVHHLSQQGSCIAYRHPVLFNPRLLINTLRISG